MFFAFKTIAFEYGIANSHNPDRILVICSPCVKKHQYDFKIQ